MSEELFDEAEVISATVTVALDGSRLDAAAAAVFTQFSRSRLAEWIRAGRLTRNGELGRPRDKVALGDQLHLFPETDNRVDWAPEPLPLDILFEDEHVIVVNKPAGLVVHPAAGHHSGTLVNGSRNVVLASRWDCAPTRQRYFRGDAGSQIDACA